ncbi:beta-lactamase family protein [Myxococcota bacterium]|nr:beta-lactamase family protein [Myxococcota bacterium]MBU1432025.1 beta-lactamase family protein [Myxococcota bacterium]MBU1899679.1 beta-lactamase family protein [Myxococcota bacterium]
MMLIEQRLRRAAHERVAPGFAFGLIAGDDPPRRAFVGRHQPDGGLAVSAETWFDLASLTKPLTTLTWALRLIDEARLDLEAPIGDLIEVADPALAAAPLWRLLNHSSGLPAHRPYFEGLGRAALRAGQLSSARAMIQRLARGAALEQPPGAREVYSDLGFMLLEQICARADRPLEVAWSTLPGHGAEALSFRPLRGTAPQRDEACAATERCPWRARLLQGEVHDDNCWTMGGIAGHAGLFGRLDDVLSLASAYLRGLRGDGAALGLRASTLAALLDPRWMHPRGSFALGWDTPTPGRSTSGARFSRRAVGHLGFTGTSIWIDVERAVVMVLLTNRVSPSRVGLEGIRALRPQIHDLAWEELG